MENNRFSAKINGGDCELRFSYSDQNLTLNYSFQDPKAAIGKMMYYRSQWLLLCCDDLLTFLSPCRDEKWGIINSIIRGYELLNSKHDWHVRVAQSIIDDYSIYIKEMPTHYAKKRKQALEHYARILHECFKYKDIYRRFLEHGQRENIRSKAA